VLPERVGRGVLVHQGQGAVAVHLPVSGKR
jgi:hypothetical protein